MKVIELQTRKHDKDSETKLVKYNIEYKILEYSYEDLIVYYPQYKSDEYSMRISHRTGKAEEWSDITYFKYNYLHTYYFGDIIDARKCIDEDIKRISEQNKIVMLEYANAVINEKLKNTVNSVDVISHKL